MAYPWIKLWTEFVNDPKIVLLPEHLQLVYVKLLCICGEYDQQRKGWLPTPRRLAVTLRSTPEQVLTDLCALAETDPDDPDDAPLVARCGERWMIAKFEARQGAMNATARSAASRDKQHKGAYYGGTDATPVAETRNEDATEVQRSVAQIRLDIDVDKIRVDTETGGANAPRHDEIIPFSDDPPEEEEPEPAPRKRSKPRADPRSQHPAILAIQTILKRMPSKAQYDVIIKALGDDPPNVPRLRLCYDAWVVRGFRPDNLAWATEWYAQGGPPQRGANGRDTPPVRYAGPAVDWDQVQAEIEGKTGGGDGP